MTKEAYNTRRILTVVTFLLLYVVTVLAQNNAYKLNDEVYKYFVYVDRFVTAPGTPERCDTLFQLAKAKGDVKAQCLSKYERSVYYAAQKDIPRLIQSVNEAKEFCKGTPYLQYYFGSWDNLIGFYIQEKQFNTALDELDRYQKEALLRNNVHGTAYSMILTGDIYYYSHHYRYARYKYEQALAYCQQTGYQSIARLYECLALCCFQLQDYDKAIAYTQDVIDHPQCTPNYRTMVCHTALLFACAKEPFDREEATKWYNTILKDNNTNEEQEEADLTLYQSIKELYHARMDNRAWKANTNIRHFQLPFRRIQRFMDDQLGDSNALLFDLQEIVAHERRNEEEASRVILEYQSDKQEQEQQARRKDSIENVQTMLALMKAQLEHNREMLDQEEQKDEIERQRLENDRSAHMQKIQDMKIRRQQQQAELDAQNDIIKEKQERIRLKMQRIQIGVGSVLALTVLVAGIFIIIFIRSRMKALSMERQHAREADREKTLFYRTMSTEIRTPLNAILGFNEILNSDVAKELSEQERRKIAGYIRANSELLTTMVNDVLDISKLESGTYKLYYTDFTVHSLIEAVVMATGVDNNRHSIVMHHLEEGTLHSDHQRLQQLLTILTGFACRTTTEDINISARLLEGGLTFRIRFTGKDEFTRQNVDNILQLHESLHGNTMLDNNSNMRIAILIARLLNGRLFTLSTNIPEECMLCFEMPAEVFVAEEKGGVA